MVKHLLIIETTPTVNWYRILAGMHILGEEVHVEQAQYSEISVTAYSDMGCVCVLAPARQPLEGTPQNTERTINPDFLFVRSVTRALEGQDSRNILYAFMFSGLPSVNSLESIYCCLERPIVYGELLKSHKKLGDRFPLIPQTLYPNFRSMIITPEYPLVAKVGHAHAGYGKIKLHDHHQFEDFRSVCALSPAYVSAEPFIDWDYDIRVQKIGNHYRAFHRRNPNWKGNVGSSIIEDAPMTPEYQLWVDEAATYFGGLDICAVDALHRKSDDKCFILEVNDTAIGLVHKYEPEDYQHMRELIETRMTAYFSAPRQQVPPQPTAGPATAVAAAQNTADVPAPPPGPAPAAADPATAGRKKLACSIA
ncbi:putative synapsin IIb [Paratrimastix pyriformis]|uniref:Synapsin IIb n=1 Tax=Paratrimastix pyriformis TaxID=342808 RepID=A0ABQ8UXV6_9EUKA|nr:putative synapsin IIb [Paratrimastix pyriformis]